MGMKRNRKELRAALDSGEPVRLHRSLWKADRLVGIVVGLGPTWVVLHSLDDVILDGWHAVRLDSVARVERRGANSFAARVLRARGQAAQPLDIDLGATPDLLADLGEKFPLLSIHREGLDPSVCAIGKPVRLGKRKLHLLDIDPDGLWDHGPRRFAYEDITRVDVDGRYERALHELGGYPPIPT
ncbi:MAG TPA: hypothetical protein VNS19_15675 [Acidimicrobiales bacterium]|nr:hypothetical protein [Acidimicrobiales bacterium]